MFRLAYNECIANVAYSLPEGKQKYSWMGGIKALTIENVNLTKG